MEMQLSEVEGVRMIALSGRLDSAGVEVIETRFSAATVPVGANILVDLSEVAFLASLGVRMFIATTRALSWKGAKMVLFGATPAVMETIETLGFDDIVPVVNTQSEALALLAA
jgi:anti-sigma B factor antagonist